MAAVDDLVDVCNDSLEETLAVFAGLGDITLGDITDAVMSIGCTSSAATGREFDARMLSVWNVMGSWL